MDILKCEYCGKLILRNEVAHVSHNKEERKNHYYHRECHNDLKRSERHVGKPT